MAMFSVAGVERACRESACAMGYANVRDQQLRVVTNFVRGSDVFAVLPTGYGKGLCYALLPSVFDRLLGKDDSIVVVITPLTAIINDQVSSCMSGTQTLPYRFSVCLSDWHIKVMTQSSGQDTFCETEISKATLCTCL